MYDIPFDRSFLQLSNGIRHVMPSTDRKLELTAKASMAQPVSQPAVCCSGLRLNGKQQQGPDSLLKHTHLSHSHGMILSAGCENSPRTC